MKNLAAYLHTFRQTCFTQMLVGKLSSICISSTTQDCSRASGSNTKEGGALPILKDFGSRAGEQGTKCITNDLSQVARAMAVLHDAANTKDEFNTVGESFE